MIAPASALVLVGSPKKGMSTSEVLGSHLVDRLGARGIPGGVVRLHRALRTTETLGELLATIDRTDLVVLATPLYVDSLPSHVIAVLEQCAARRATAAAATGQRFACVINCGFPEARHNETAIRICREFARQAGFEWAGGLALGGGETISGQPLERRGRTARHVVEALDLVADAFAEGGDIPTEAVALMAKPFMPATVFTLVADIFWRARAARLGVWQLNARPYGNEADDEKRLRD